MVILALDIASKTGWAVKRPGEVIESGMQNFTKKRGESEGMIYIRFRAWLKQMIEMVKPTVVVYEMPHMRGAGTTLLMGLETRLHEVHAEMDGSFEYQKVHSTQIKKAATGNAKASKPDVIKAVEARIGRQVIDDNESDSVALIFWAEQEYALVTSASV